MSSKHKLEITMKPGSLAPSHGGPMQYVTWSVCLNGVEISSALEKRLLGEDLSKAAPPYEVQNIHDLLYMALSRQP